MAWEGSDRRAELPANWSSEIVPAVKARDGHRCVATRRDGTRCWERKNLEVDHIGDKHDHRMENLRTLCHWHHVRRTALQAQAARTPVSQSRPPEVHPGMR